MKTIDSNVLSIRRKIAVTGALGALTVFLGITHLGLIPWFSGAAITILHIPVILGTLLEGLPAGLGIGAVFGIFSMIQASMAPTGAIDPYFVNPLISVLPRLLIAVVTYVTINGLLSLSSKLPKFPSIIMYAAASFIGSLANTVFVLTALVFAKAISWQVLITVVIANGLLEAAASLIICTAVIGVVKGISAKKMKLAVSDEDTD